MSKIKTNTIENVAGTESHSVDTMGIESGSNANGNYTKFPDGTMIQYGNKNSSGASWDGDKADYFGTTAGSVKLYTHTVNFPVSFVGTPVVSAQPSNYYMKKIDVEVLSASFSAGVYIDDSQDQGASYFSWMAIGRWK